MDSNFSPKKFAVIGAGPVGCIVAAFLARGGYEVTLCDILPELIEPAKDPGIKIEGAENLEQKISSTCTLVDELAKSPPEVLIITVKANALPLLASAIETFYRPGMYVVSEALGRKAVMRAVVNYGCNLVKPGHVRMGFHHPPHFIQEMDLESGPAALAIAEALTRSGLTTRHTDQIVSMVWRKTILNACMNPVCAVTGLTMAQAMNDPIVFQIVDALIKECVAVARANEIPLGWEFYPYALDYMKRAGDHKPSMLIDIERKRLTEIDFMNGKFVEYGERAELKTPYNKTLRALVKALEPK